jgi:hypothetical protein
MERLVDRVEQKYFVCPGRMILALALLKRTCRRDSSYPEEQINSLYFDTPGLDEHLASLGGEFAKSKIRIRWYGQEHDPHGRNEGAGRIAGAETLPVWMELKQRKGFASTKHRTLVQVMAGALEPRRLSRGIVPAQMLTRTLAGFGFVSAKSLCPVVAISYFRHRFVEPQTGFRVAFDSHIRSTMVMAGRDHHERGLELSGAVVEVKGPTAEFPSCLLPLRDLGSSWTRFSKYSSSLEAHDAEIGGISRLWPSGFMSGEAITRCGI